MTWGTIARHGSVLLAVLSGIGGMGLVFDAVSHGSVRDLTFGVPALLIGLWWAGRALGMSILAGKARSARSSTPENGA
jgi:hypothetical protein